MSGVFLNPRCDDGPIGGGGSSEPRRLHRRLPGYEVTPLQRVPTLARALGVGEVFVKDETSRLGLPAFKILGGAWGVYRALERFAGERFDPDASFEELRARVKTLGPLTLATATAGNHGRGVARVARLLGLAAEITVPAGTQPARIEALVAEGARVIEFGGDYDSAVVQVLGTADERTLVIQDNATEAESDMVRWIVEGYGTLFHELDEQLVRAGKVASTVFLPVGAGALAAAGIAHFRAATRAARPIVVGVEPTDAACALAALRAGEVVRVDGPQRSIMAGMNCARIAAPAWPYLRDGMRAIVTIDDGACRSAMTELRELGIEVGECGAAGLAGLERAAVCDEREALGLGADATVVLLATEGRTSGD